VRDFHASKTPPANFVSPKPTLTKPAWYRTILFLYRELEFFISVNVRAILSHP